MSLGYQNLFNSGLLAASGGVGAAAPTMTPDAVVVNVALFTPADVGPAGVSVTPSPLVINVEVPAIPPALTPDPVVVNVEVPAPTVDATAAVKPDPVVVQVAFPSATVALAPLQEPDPVVVHVAIPTPEVLISPLLEPGPVTVRVTLPDASIQYQVAPDVVVTQVNLPAASVLVENWVQFGNITREIDPGDWANDVEFYFEAVIETTNAATTARARLYDVTNDQEIASSEVTTTSTDPVRLRSGEITLPVAATEYRAEFGAYVGDNDIVCYAADVVAVVPSS